MGSSPVQQSTEKGLSLVFECSLKHRLKTLAGRQTSQSAACSSIRSLTILLGSSGKKTCSHDERYFSYRSVLNAFISLKGKIHRIHVGTAEKSDNFSFVQTPDLCAHFLIDCIFHAHLLWLTGQHELQDASVQCRYIDTRTHIDWDTVQTCQLAAV